MENQSLIPTEDHSEEIISCQNCEAEISADYEFCPHCGQKTNDDLTIGVLFYNTISNYFSFDARFLKSFFPLMFKPGQLPIKFIQGKRLLYLHPAQMYLFVSVIFFFVISFSTRELVQEADQINEKVVNSDMKDEFEGITAKPLDSAQIEQIMKPIKDNQGAMGLKDADLKIADSILKNNSKVVQVESDDWGFSKRKVDSLRAAGAEDDEIYKAMGMSDDAGYFEQRLFSRLFKLMEGQGAGSIVQAFFDSIPISMFFLLPVFAFILKIFYFNKGKYAHHLVFSFYFFSFLFTVLSILFAVNRFVHPIPDWIDWLIVISTYFYFLIALIRFYRQNWILTWFKSGVITFIFFLFVIPVAFGILAAFSFFTT